MNLFDSFDIVPLSATHNKNGFDCGNEILNVYLKTRASQDQRNNYASVFVATPKISADIAGYYTLSMASVELGLLPESLKKKLPQYPSIPAVRLGRLAIDKKFQGQQLGKLLLMDSLCKSVNAPIAWRTFIVDAIDDNAVTFYIKYGFIQPTPDERFLYIMREMIEQDA